ncbi:mannose-6-phosphate isomerase [Ketogulonicigenium robustum]|uniref:Mannose-6-phosphate isomerase n=1 Tax=Ketogulonicigenium robustum TaxID=92947 RepID=A0A1W6NWH0_9RHOB|nr:AGE family epimerase/isomerase [Ketogulonicigenium robustum]ARO13559.1 mannose-6-phosphate isomerase [Ketogulonicigenium robustum]
MPAAFDFSAWIRHRALPFWRARGLCPNGFGAVEHIRADGSAALYPLRRSRVHARQAFVFAAAARDMGTDDLPLAQHLLAFAHRTAASGFIPIASDNHGRPVGDAHRLYDLAFYILANAECPAPVIPWDWLKQALAKLRAPLGWWDDRLRCAPRTQNAHMHLFEAASAAHRATGDPDWAEVADECRALFLTVFLQPDGTVLELFDAHWRPVKQGQRVEPGHGAEWVYLGHQDPQIAAAADLDTIFSAATRALGHAGFLPDQADDPLAGRRLWPQTELLRAALAQRARGRVLPPHLTPEAIIQRIAHSYLTPQGGWIDARDHAGRITAAHMPSSSFYHIFNAWRAWHDVQPRAGLTAGARASQPRRQQIPDHNPFVPPRAPSPIAPLR